MSYEIYHIFEAKKLVWVVALVCCMVITSQYYIEFPYGHIASSLFSASEAQLAENGTHHKHEASSQITKSLDSNNSDAASPITTFRLPPANLTLATRIGAPVTAMSKTLPKTTYMPDFKSSAKVFPPMKKSHKRPTSMGDIVTISKMYDMLLHNRATVLSMKPRWSASVDQELVDAKLQIENAPFSDKDLTFYPLYRNYSRFKRSYELMEKTLKVYIYTEGEKPIFHQPETVLTGVYASEGWFMKNMQESKHFVTKNTKKAHLFYIPFSSRILEVELYVNGSHSKKNMVQYLKSYINMIAGKYDFWNRTEGSDHFVVACHDWATYETRKSMDSCIRALCNSDVNKEFFELGKDVSLPETSVRSSDNPIGDLGGKPPSKRKFLAFFAGRMHGNVRPVLLQHWENKDPDMKIFSRLQKSKNNPSYIQYMKSSKYCICAKGYEVNSPRVVEAIFHECVPVIISDNFVPPFFEILNWESFAVFVQEKDIPNLKNILLSISKRRYLVMQQNLKRVQQHFMWHFKPVKYDIFHMILHSVWYNRVFRVNPAS